MKLRSIHSVILSVFLLSGCVFGEQTDVQQPYIGFTPVIGHETRASEEAIPFPENLTFNVHATRFYDNAPVITDETISCAFNGWYSKQKWDDSDLVVAAYYPSSLNVEYQRSKGYSIKDFTLTSPDDDILIAAETQAKCDDRELVTLHFEHKLSKIDFRVHHSLAANIKVKIKSIKIEGFSKTGSYNLTRAHEWDVNADRESIIIYDAYEGLEQVVTNSSAYIGEEFSVIPQYFLADITATFLVKSGNGGWVTEELTVSEHVTDWIPGQLYTYTLNLTDQKLTCTTGITSWTSK